MIKKLKFIQTSQISKFHANSYKENDSTQETDSDEVLEARDGVVEEEDLSEKIEKIMDRRVFDLSNLIQINKRSLTGWKITRDGGRYNHLQCQVTW